MSNKANWIEKIFPQYRLKNISIFYALTALNNCWFIAANWIFFWTRFMTYGQLGLMDATAFGFGLLMEIPSGAISDLIGKRKTIILSMFLASISVFAFSFSWNLYQLWVAFFFAQAGWAFYSGSAEALAYDTLVDHKQEEDFDKVISTHTAIAAITTIISILVGGALFVWHFRLPHIVWGFTYFLAWIISFGLSEPRTDTVDFTFSSYMAQLTEGVKELFKTSLLPYSVVILSLMGADVLYNWGLVKPAMAIYFGFFDKEQAVLFALFSLVGSIIVKFLPSIRKIISDKKGLYLLTLFMGLAFSLAYFQLEKWGIIIMLVISVTGHLAFPWISVVVNQEIPSKYRATTLSTVALITKIPYVLLAILAGSMVENGQFGLFSLGVGLAIIMSIVVSASLLMMRKRRSV